MNVLVSIVGLGFLILIHEAGHFFTALAVRMRPRKFYVFFPPPVLKTTRNGIEYGIGAIPLGGYVKIPGMHRPAAGDLDAHLQRAADEAHSIGTAAAPVRAALEQGRLDEARAGLPELRQVVERAHLSEAARKTAERGLTDVEDGLSDDAYWKAPAWRRVSVIAAGPLTNLVACIVLLTIVFMLGVPVGTTKVVEEVRAGMPASEIGLLPGDEILAIDGTPVATFEDIRPAIEAGEGAPVTVTVLRDGERVELGPAAPVRQDGRLLLGFSPGQEMRSYGLGPAIGKAFEDTGRVTAEIGKSLGRIVTGSGRDEVSSPIGIVQGSSQALDVGFRYYLQLLALISLSLALLNLLPLLPLDGGHILFSLLEKVRGRAIPREAYERASAIGIALVLILFVIGLSNDIGRLGG
ncbi:MAG: site-2 protease family protein [Thermoleophilia bacterium]